MVDKDASGHVSNASSSLPPSLPPSSQELVVVDKDASGLVTTRPMMGVRYVPLTPPSEMPNSY